MSQDTKIIQTPPHITMATMGHAAKKAASFIAQTSTDQINKTLQDIAGALIEQSSILIEVNQKDLNAAKDKDLSPALIDRLTLPLNAFKISQQVSQKLSRLMTPLAQF